MISTLGLNPVATLIYAVLAEVPGAAQVNLQLAEHLLFCKQYSKICPSAFSILSPQAQGGGGEGQTCTKTLLGQVRMCVENFIKIGAGVWISISPPHTNRQTDKHLYTHFYIYRRIRYIDCYQKDEKYLCQFLRF